MARGTTLLQAFNRGILSPLALARIDIERVALSAETQRNWIPRALGSMTFRAGSEYLGSTQGNNFAYQIPFYFSIGQQYELEMTTGQMRVWKEGELQQTGYSAAAVADPDFDDPLLPDWTNDSEGGLLLSQSASQLILDGDGTNECRAYQEIVIPSGEVTSEQGYSLQVVVARGPVTLRLGSAANDGSYLNTTLGTGTHILTIVPTGNVFITFANRNNREALIASCYEFTSATVINLPTAYSESDLSNLRYDQSADVVYLACEGIAPYKVERRSDQSWSIVEYKPDDGPFRTINTSNITMAPSGLNKNITLTASRAYFESGHVGALFRLEAQGQEVTDTITGQDQWTDPIRVSGVDDGRVFVTVAEDVTTPWTATLTVQRSVESENGPWEDTGFSTTRSGTTTTINRDDSFDNQIIWYRYGVKTGDFGASSNIDLTLIYTGGTSSGVGRVTSVTSDTVAQIEVLDDFGGTDATLLWYESEWSALRGYPSAVCIYEGRLWWFGKNKIIGSESDNYENFSPETEGDSGLINRTIGYGPVDQISWALPLQRLLVGTPSKEISCRSTSFDEPLTPTDFNQKDASTMGSDYVAAIKMDANGIYVQRSGERLMLLSYELNNNDYTSGDLTQLNPELLRGGVRRLAVQRMPDNRIHIVLDDGRVMILLIDTTEDIRCFVEVDMAGGLVEDVVVQPDYEEDRVYYIVKRTINGNEKRYRERWSLESECIGGDLSKNLDAHTVFTAVGSDTLTGLSHLEGETVRCWADGVPQGQFTVTSGQIVLPASVTNAVVGLPYEALYKSTKLAYLSQAGAALNKRKVIDKIGLVLQDTHHKGLLYGSRADDDYEMPDVEQGVDVATDTVWSQYDLPSFGFPSEHETDARLYLRAKDGLPVTVLGVTLTQETRD